MTEKPFLPIPIPDGCVLMEYGHGDAIPSGSEYIGIREYETTAGAYSSTVVVKRAVMCFIVPKGNIPEAPPPPPKTPQQLRSKKIDSLIAYGVVAVLFGGIIFACIAVFIK